MPPWPFFTRPVPEFQVLECASYATCKNSSERHVTTSDGSKFSSVSRCLVKAPIEGLSYSKLQICSSNKSLTTGPTVFKQYSLSSKSLCLLLRQALERRFQPVKARSAEGGDRRVERQLSLRLVFGTWSLTYGVQRAPHPRPDEGDN